MKARSQGLGTIFAPLLLIAVVSLVGLFSALTGDGVRDAMSWAALGIPVLVIGWAVVARRS